jgi:hypothetical protein
MKGRDFLRQVNAVLHRDWDPIRCGVPLDEYESYAGPVATLLLNGSTDAQIVAYLDKVETEIMGLGGPFPPERFAAVIASLRALEKP